VFAAQTATETLPRVYGAMSRYVFMEASAKFQRVGRHLSRERPRKASAPSFRSRRPGCWMSFCNGSRSVTRVQLLIAPDKAIAQNSALAVCMRTPQYKSGIPLDAAPREGSERATGCDAAKRSAHLAA
jgi:hypothetical protein